MTSLSLAQGGPRPAELPPTLQPSAIASMAPRTDRRAAAGYSLLSYALLGTTMALVAATHPKPVKKEHVVSPPITLNEYQAPVQASLQPPTAKPGGNSGAALGDKRVEVQNVPVANNLVPDTPTGFSDVNHSGEPVNTDPNGRWNGGSKDLNPSTNTSSTDQTGPGTGPVEISMAQVQVVSAVNPAYPAAARLIRVQGPVELLMTIDTQGVPTDVKVLSGHAAFHAEATRAARLWRFEPARMGGQAVPAVFRLTINFRLQ